jgi:hypothetical protein
VQKGKKVAVQKFISQRLPFSPRYVLYDIHRVYFRSISSSPLSDGTHQIQNHGETITERWADGQLRERRFSRIDQQPAGEIRIRYFGKWKTRQPPSKIEYENRWFGYRLTIHTLDSSEN